MTIRLSMKEVELAIMNMRITSKDDEAVLRLLNQLLNTMRDNERLYNAISNLKPIADQDWHGKWRIKKVIDLCSDNSQIGNQNKHPDHSEDMLDMVSTQNTCNCDELKKSWGLRNDQKLVCTICDDRTKT